MNSEFEGVQCVPFICIPDERGVVSKVSMPPFDVKDVYVTSVFQNAIKAWHGYETKSIYFSVIRGLVRFVMFDARYNSKTFKQTETLFLGSGIHWSILVPPGVYSGFKGITRESIILVQANEPYGQIYRQPWNSPDIDYDWSIQNG